VSWILALTCPKMRVCRRDGRESVSWILALTPKVKVYRRDRRDRKESRILALTLSMVSEGEGLAAEMGRCDAAVVGNYKM